MRLPRCSEVTSPHRNRSATGTLQPVNLVDVGSELSGIIKTVEVDFNDRVQRTIKLYLPNLSYYLLG